MSDRANFGKDSRTPRQEARQRRKVASAFEQYGRALTGRPAAVPAALVGTLWLVALILWIVKMGLAALIIFWNVTDIQNVGPNFWNVFWLVVAAIAAILILGGNRR